MLTYTIIAVLVFCTSLLFMGWRNNCDDEDTSIILLGMLCSLLWPVAIVCALVWFEGKCLLKIGRDLRCLRELRRKP